MINATLTPYRVVVGSTDITPLVVSCVGSRTAIDFNICLNWQFTVSLADPLASVGTPSLLSPERGIWVPGTPAEIYVTDSCGDEHLFRRLKVWKISYDRNRFVAEAILRCQLGIARGKTEPEGAVSASPQEPRTRIEMILECIEKAGIQGKEIDLIPDTMEDEFSYPAVKADNPYLDTAQQLATPAQQWFWSHADESIRFYFWRQDKTFQPLFVLKQEDLIELSADPDVDHLPKAITASGTRTDINIWELKSQDLDTYMLLRNVYKIYPMRTPRSDVFGDEPILYKRVRTEESGDPTRFLRVETTFVCLGALATKFGIDRGELGYMFLDPSLPPPIVNSSGDKVRLNPLRPEGTRLTDLFILSRKTTEEYYSDQIVIPGRVERGDRRIIKRIEKLEQPRCVLRNHYNPFFVPPGIKHDFQLEVLPIEVTTTDYISRRITRESLEYGEPVDKRTELVVNGRDPVLISSTYEIQGGPPAGEEYLALDRYDVIPPEEDPPSATFAATKETPLEARVPIQLSSFNPLATEAEAISVPFCLTEEQMRRVAETAVDLKLGHSRAINLVLALPDHLIRNPDDLWKMIVIDDLCYFIDTPTYGFTERQARFGCRGIFIGRLASTPTPYCGIPDFFPTTEALEMWFIPTWTLYVGVALTTTVWIPVSGGVPPYEFTGTGLPAGLTLDAGGGIYGIPLVQGTYTVTLTVTDSDGSQSTRSFEIRVIPLPTFFPFQSSRIDSLAGIVMDGSGRFVPYDASFSFTFEGGIISSGLGGVGFSGETALGGAIGYGVQGQIAVGAESNLLEVGVETMGLIGEMIEDSAGNEVGGIIDYYLSVTIEVSGTIFVRFP